MGPQVTSPLLLPLVSECLAQEDSCIISFGFVLVGVDHLGSSNTVGMAPPSCFQLLVGSNDSQTKKAGVPTQHLKGLQYALALMMTQQRPGTVWRTKQADLYEVSIVYMQPCRAAKAI